MLFRPSEYINRLVPKLDVGSQLFRPRSREGRNLFGDSVAHDYDVMDMREKLISGFQRANGIESVEEAFSRAKREGWLKEGVSNLEQRFLLFYFIRCTCVASLKYYIM